jgi:multiple sugar transport system ATP-binding protein
MKASVENLTKRFDSVVAIENLTATFKSGELIALLGPSGCGKSTMLNMLSGIIPVSEGKVFFDDKDVTELPPQKRNVGLVFQNYALYPHMTVLENICFPLSVKRIPKKLVLEKAHEMAALVQIADLMKRKPHELSGGQQQRVAIARALIKSPSFLLLDEPLSNLDAKLRVEMREEIRRIQREAGVTTIFVTHDQEEASSIADSIMLLKNGVVQQYDTVRSLYDDPANLFVAEFLGAPAINQLKGRLGPDGFLADEASTPIAIGKQLGFNGKAVLAVRPESLSVNKRTKDFEASVIDHYLAGKDALAVVDYAGQRLRAFVDPEEQIEPGDLVSLGFKNRGVFLFDQNTGERLL